MAKVIIIAGLWLSASAQINLGVFNMNKNPRGEWELGFNQAANILGFGGDRAFKLTGGQQGLGIQTNQGGLIGGERVGLDSSFGLNKDNGLGLGSVLSFGNQPSNAPGGQLESFIHNIGRFFHNLGGSSQPGPSLSGNMGSVGVPALRERPAPQIPTEEIDTEDIWSNERRSTFPTLIDPKNGGPLSKGKDQTDRLESEWKNEGDARRQSSEHINHGDEEVDRDILENIDEKPEFSTRFKSQSSSTKSRQLPGLVDMQN